ncbi:MAG: bifunctional phosphoglucose/phosphomannose isomerase [Candidatus Thorarchaeota archaeon]|jgi:glucose/mannose-6-phosphate isomerase
MKTLDGIDKTSMSDMTAKFPSMLRLDIAPESILQEAENSKLTGVGGICITGMGGSGIAGEICKALMADVSEIPIVSNQEYSLPRYINEEWVVIAISYSGETEETLSAFDIARQRDCRTFALTTGGTLAVKADVKKTMTLPSGLQPRAALPVIISGLLPLLEILIGIERSDLNGIADALEQLQPDWNGATLVPEKLAAELQNKIPWFIGWKHLVPVAYRAKCQFNENSKILASSSQIPEIYHNEIEGTLSCRNHPISPVFLRSREEDEKTKIGFESAAAIFKENGCHPKHLNLRFDSRIEEALGFTMFLDLASVRLAEILGVDPVSVERIAQLKRRLRG